MRSRVRKWGTGTVPVTPTFKCRPSTFREIQSRDSQHPRTGCYPKLPPLQIAARPALDEMLTLSESGIEPREGVAPHISRPWIQARSRRCPAGHRRPERFIPGGALEVAGDTRWCPCALMDRFDVVVFSQDWHCPGHLSFASSHGEPVRFDPDALRRPDPVARPLHPGHVGFVVPRRPVHPGPRPRRAQGFQEGYRLVQRILRERSDHPDGARGIPQGHRGQEGVCVRARIRLLRQVHRGGCQGQVRVRRGGGREGRDEERGFARDRGGCG